MGVEKPPLSFWQIWNMSFGFLGIQFGWALQMANMSAIYEYLGADAHQIPILWLAAPLTGLLVQPIIGHMSDRTWNRLGRRRPYFLVGALLASFALIAMPNSSALWMAAGLLWVLDASINISMEPFRAFVADLLPAAAAHARLRHAGALHRARCRHRLDAPLAARPTSSRSAVTVDAHRHPARGEAAPSISGAFVFLAAVLWTVFTTREHPPEDMEAFRRMKAEKAGIRAGASRDRPRRARDAARPCGAWPGCRSSPGSASSACGSTSAWRWPATSSAARPEPRPTSRASPGVATASRCTRPSASLFSFALPTVAERLGRKLTHGLCLLAGAIGLLSVAFISDKYVLLLSMVGVGVAWASILSMPYAILAGALPAGKTGIYMGIFNFFIVIPEILAALVFGRIMEQVLTDDSALVRLLGGDNRLAAVVIGGVSLAVAAALCTFVIEPTTAESSMRSSPDDRRKEDSAVTI